MVFKQGDVLHYTTAGGGGYGDPLDRDPSAVLWDWINEKVTAEHAREAYGVVIEEHDRQVDEQATAQLRTQLGKQRRVARSQVAL